MSDQPASGEPVAGLVAELWAVHDLMEDRGTCPYYRRGEEGQDPTGTCSFGCRDEPSCQTDHGGPEFPWASEMMRDLIARVEQVGWMAATGTFFYEARDVSDDEPAYRLTRSGSNGTPS